MTRLAEDRIEALRDELGHMFEGDLADAFIDDMVATHGNLEAFGDDGDTEAFEDRVAHAGDHLSAAIVKTALVSLDTKAPFIRHRGETYSRECASRKRVMTSFGVIDYERSRYRRRARRSVFPADSRAGLIEDFWTPRAARIALHMVSALPPRECVKAFRQRGAMVPSVSSLVRLYEAAGRHWEEIADEALSRVREGEELAREAGVITVQMDGVMIAMGQDRRAQKQPLGAVEWKEASCATVTLGTTGGDPLRTVRHARMPERNKLRLKQFIRDEVASLLARRPDLALVTVANGAKDHWRFFDEAFPQADQVLDFYHAAEHLKAALDEAYGTNSEKATRRWHTLRNTLLNDPRGVDRVIASLDYLRRCHAPSIAATIGYFRNNRHRMAYADCRARNLVIGSGLVEATNKGLVTRRMKGSGMIWGQSGGQAILSLRALDMSGRFNTAWPLLREHWQKNGTEQL